MAIVWQFYGKFYGRCMANLWEMYGKLMGNWWQIDGI
jgi:hypothetical protein